MFKHPFATVVASLLVLCALLPFAPVLAADEASAEQDHIAVLALGAEGGREISEGTSHLGPAVGVEFEPIEHWLEIEFGASTYRSQGATNWELELPFKKPFRLSSTIEVMPGLGPTWEHTTQPGERPGTWGAKALIDLFFWRSQRLGWYLAPSYGIAFGNSNKTSVALNAGVFIAVP